MLNAPQMQFNHLLHHEARVCLEHGLSEPGYQVLIQIRKDLIVLPAGAVYLQVAQEVQYILLLGCTQHIEIADHLVGFRAAACMLLDRS
jgi:hypothetical protein